MPVAVPSAVPAGQGGGGLSGPGRDGLIGELLAGGALDRAAAEGGHGCLQQRALTAEMTLLCLVTGALFPDQGYGMILAKAFAAGGARVRPGTPVPAGPALSQARARLGERPARRAFEIDAARRDVPPAAGGTAGGLDLVLLDGTMLDLFNCPELAAEFGVPRLGTRPKLRLVALLQASTMRWKAAALGTYHDAETSLADRLQPALGPGQLCLADRFFFSMDRWLRFSGTGAHLLWRVKDAARSVPFRRLRVLEDGSELVLLRESPTMLWRRRREAGSPALPPLPGTAARLVCFTVLSRARSGRTRKTAVRVLTTLLDPAAFPARQVAALYAARWQVETAFLHLKKTVLGPGRVLRGRSPELARQETWAMLLVHNMTAALAARAAADAGAGLAAVSFTAVLSLLREHAAPGRRCPRCGCQPAASTGQLTAAIAAQPLNRENRKRTSGRTKTERRKWHTEEATYEITITPSNLPKADISPTT